MTTELVIHRGQIGNRTLPLPRGEDARLDAHFVDVLRCLETHPPPRLSPVQRRERARHLERLEGYRRRARFPRNKRFPGQRIPHFIDEAGTRCAMGQLIELGGGRDLVQHIARERNYARIRELVDLPELVAWIEANGLTAEEAARIQPTYCGTPAQNCLCGNLSGGYIQGTVGDGGSTVVVTAVYGPVQGVAPGDTLQLQDTYGAGTSYESVFANHDGVFAFGSSNGEVTIPETNCWNSWVASIPGPLPLSIVEQALSVGTDDGCQQVITDHDPQWGVMQGGPECVDTGTARHDDGGCSMSPHGNDGSTGIGLAVSAIWLVRRVRRSRHRPVTPEPPSPEPGFSAPHDRLKPLV